MYAQYRHEYNISGFIFNLVFARNFARVALSLSQRLFIMHKTDILRSLIALFFQQIKNYVIFQNPIYFHTKILQNRLSALGVF